MDGASTFRNADKALRIASLGVASLALHQSSNASQSDPGRNVIRSFILDFFRPSRRLLKDLSEQAFLYRIECVAGVEVFCQKRSSGLWLLCVGDLQRVGQAAKSFDRFVVGLADLLSLVRIHRAESLSQDFFVGCFVRNVHRIDLCRFAWFYDSLLSRNFIISDIRWLISRMSPTCPQWIACASGAGKSTNISWIRETRSCDTKTAFSYAASALSFGLLVLGIFLSFAFRGLVPVDRRSSLPRLNYSNCRTFSKPIFRE